MNADVCLVFDGLAPREQLRDAIVICVSRVLLDLLYVARKLLTRCFPRYGLSSYHTERLCPSASVSARRSASS
jgi:hypothetical protein